MSLAEQVAALLLKVGVVSLNVEQPFRYSSGLWAPLYCDNRLLLSFPVERTVVTDAFVSLAQDYADIDVVVGTATAGIPYAALLAERLQLPMAYVRGQSKVHGRGNQIEGVVEAGQRVLVIEDLVSTGKSSCQVVSVLQERGAQVIGCLSIFTYGLEKARLNFEEIGVPQRAMVQLEDLLSVAIRDEQLTAPEAAMIRSWQEGPEEWSAAYESRAGVSGSE